jgi:hypothetical protein
VHSISYERHTAAVVQHRARIRKGGQAAVSLGHKALQVHLTQGWQKGGKELGEEGPHVISSLQGSDALVTRPAGGGSSQQSAATVSSDLDIQLQCV